MYKKKETYNSKSNYFSEFKLFWVDKTTSQLLIQLANLMSETKNFQ